MNVVCRFRDRTLSKGEDVVCLPGARIEHVTERVENVLGHDQGIYISSCRDEQYRQGGNSQYSTEIQIVGRENDEDKSWTYYSLRNQ